MNKLNTNNFKSLVKTQRARFGKPSTEALTQDACCLAVSDGEEVMPTGPGSAMARSPHASQGMEGEGVGNAQTRGFMPQMPKKPTLETELSRAELFLKLKATSINYLKHSLKNNSLFLKVATGRSENHSKLSY